MMNDLSYEDLKKLIVALEIERDQLKISLKQNNDSNNNSINNKSIEANTLLKQQQLDLDINNIAQYNNDAKRNAPSSTSTIFEFYEVNANILSLTSAAER